MDTFVSDRLCLLRAIRANPDDLMNWLAYSDYLRENGQDEAASAAKSKRMLIGDEERRLLTYLGTVAIGNPKHARFIGELQRALMMELNGWGRKRLSYKQWLFLWQIVWTYRSFMPPDHPAHEFVQLADEYTRGRATTT